jgi:uncharacterized protein YjbI with pentapeptide repeats
VPRAVSVYGVSQRSRVNLDCIIAALPQIITQADIDAQIDKRAEGRFLTLADYRGTRFTGPISFSGLTITGRANFDEAHFDGPVDFSRVTFEADASFRQAAFTEPTGRPHDLFSASFRFTASRFLSGVDFRGATFDENVDFSETYFHSETSAGPAAGDVLAFSVHEGGIHFSNVWFKLRAVFNNAHFDGAMWMDAVAFDGKVEFHNTRFEDYTSFQDARFGTREPQTMQGAEFTGSTFSGNVSFQMATFIGQTDLRDVTFQNAAAFDQASFSNVTFKRAQFAGAVSFAGADFGAIRWLGTRGFGAPGFTDVRFESTVNFVGTTFYDGAIFRGATFESSSPIGPLRSLDYFQLDGVICNSLVSFQIVAKKLTCTRAEFRKGVRLMVRCADVVADYAAFLEPSLLEGMPHSPGPYDPKERAGACLEWRPRILSLRHANVGKLVLANVDLGSCRFMNAHGLESLRLESNVVMPRAQPPWSPRQVLTEEQLWRVTAQRPRLVSSRLPLPDWATAYTADSAVNARDVAALYRALRRSREDAKDIAGASDFYYGEMEMRRAAPLEVGERILLWGYWLLSGYGLRAWRPGLLFVSVVAVFTLLYHYVGFSQPEPFWRCFLTAFQAATALTATDVKILSPLGEGFQLALRVIGPFLIALTLLSVYGRTRR